MRTILTFIFLATLFFLSCGNKNSNKQESQSNYIFEFTDSNYTRLTDENIDEIVKGYVKEPMDSVYAYSKIKKKGEAPYLILIFKKNGYCHFNTVKKRGSAWATLWEDSLNEELSNYIIVSDWKFEAREMDDNNLGLIFKGCFPHSCNTRSGLFYYDCEHEKGYMALLTDDDNLKKIFPFGLPENHATLCKFEELLYMENRDGVTPPYFVRILRNILALPYNRQIPYAMVTGIDEFVYDRIKGQNKFNNIKDAESMRMSCFLLDYNNDGYLDCLFFTNLPGDDNMGIYILSGKNNKIISFNNNGEELVSDGVGMQVISYKTENEKYIVVITAHGGNSAFIQNPYLFKLQDTEYLLIHNQKLLDTILHEMDYHISNG